MATITQPTGNAEWKHGLFSCCESGSDCCFSCCCPCIYAIPASEAAGEENKIWGYVTCLTGFLLGTTLPFFIIRQSVREQKGIEGSLLGDIAVVCCCSCCAMVQVKREFTD